MTAEEGYDPTPPPGLVSQAQYFASCSGGTLWLLQGAGQSAVQAVPPVSLRVYREPGDLEHDPIARANAIQQRVVRMARQALRTPIPGDGRDLIGLLAGISTDRGPGTTEVWLSTFGLPTVAPADARILMATDPKQAAESIGRWLPGLHGIRVYLILNRWAGHQPPLNSITDTWRRTFMMDVLRLAGATVVSVTEVRAVEHAAPGVPPAPPVPNLPVTTPRPPAPPHPGHLYRLTLDTSAFFLPNSPAFATSRQQVLASLRPVIDAWRAGGYARVAVVGHCARFGPPAGALALSRQRANIIAALLRQAGVSHVSAIGVGYSQPLPPSPYNPANRVVTVTAYPKTQPGVLR